MLGISSNGAFSCGGNGVRFVGCAAEGEGAGACADVLRVKINEAHRAKMQTQARATTGTTFLTANRQPTGFEALCQRHHSTTESRLSSSAKWRLVQSVVKNSLH